MMPLAVRRVLDPDRGRSRSLGPDAEGWSRAFVNATQIRDAVVNAVVATDPRPDVVVVDLGLTPDLDVPALDALIDLRDRLQGVGSAMWLTTDVDLVRDRLRVAGLVDDSASPVFGDVAGALLAYLSVHSSGSVGARRVVLVDLLEFIRTRRQHPDLDDRGRATLDAVEALIRQELDPT